MRRKQPNLLQTVHKKRGYLLSYHRLLYDIDPELLAAYDAFYTRFTLADKVLSPAIDCWIEAAKMHQIPAPFRGKARKPRSNDRHYDRGPGHRTG